ncbi:MAG: MBL fold metallo-hydrolase [Gemmatimonadetes bacterium]|nr:MBL fold metallo-hydrolase [Gemmatimonadota bacterium]
MPVETIAEGTHLVDVEYLGRPLGIAACVLETDAGLLIVDPGPTTSVEGLHAGLAQLGAGMADVTALVLTHIHLDHAGVAGVLTAAQPQLRVFVHARGAPHLVDPSRLLDSALRIYGDELERLFGAVLPVPVDRIRALEGGELLRIGKRSVRVLDAPGHARHHVVYLDETGGTVFVGDNAGERFAPAGYVLPVTPPPDIDLEAWATTIEAMRELEADRLFLTHFGPARDPAEHLDRLETELDVWARRVRESLDGPGGDEARAAAFVEQVVDEIRARVPAGVAGLYLGGGIADSWHGLARYWRKARATPPPLQRGGRAS